MYVCYITIEKNSVYFKSLIFFFSFSFNGNIKTLIRKKNSLEYNYINRIYFCQKRESLLYAVNSLTYNSSKKRVS